jgi:ureidoglycolate lyase
MQIKTLTLEPATPEAIAPFGALVGAKHGGDPLPTAFYDGKVKLYRPEGFISEDDTEITVALIDRRPLRVRWMERHFKHTQVFLPLGAKPFIAVLAPPTQTELPDLDDARAFLFKGDVGLSMHLGTWHEFPFAVVDETQVVVVLRREATNGLMLDTVIDGEGHSPDLEKKDINRRLGVTLEVAAETLVVA